MSLSRELWKHHVYVIPVGAIPVRLTKKEEEIVEEEIEEAVLGFIKEDPILIKKADIRRIRPFSYERLIANKKMVLLRWSNEVDKMKREVEVTNAYIDMAGSNTDLISDYRVIFLEYSSELRRKIKKELIKSFTRNQLEIKKLREVRDDAEKLLNQIEEYENQLK